MIWTYLPDICIIFLKGKTVHPKNVITTTKKRATRNKSKGKANPATGTLASYFKIQAKTDHLHIGGHLSSEKLNTKRLGDPSSGCDQTVPRGKKTATSLILFEEVNALATRYSWTCNLTGMRPHVTHLIWAHLFSAPTGWCHIWRGCWFPCSHQDFHDNH